LRKPNLRKIDSRGEEGSSMQHAPTEKMQQSNDKLTETTSWADIAKELDSYAAQVGGENSGSSSGETIEVKDLLRTLRERHGNVNVGDDSDSEDEILPY